MSRLESDRALVPARARDHDPRQLRDRKARTCAAASRLELVEGTIADRDLVHRAFENFRPTHVVHAAAAYKDPNDWREDVETNVLGTINLIEAARAIGATRFVNFQTVLCYGRAAQNADPGGLSARAVHELRHFESCRRAIPCGQRPQLGLAAARQCHRPAPRYRADSDLLQASQGPAAVLLYGRYPGLS